MKGKKHYESRVSSMRVSPASVCVASLVRLLEMTSVRLSRIPVHNKGLRAVVVVVDLFQSHARFRTDGNECSNRGRFEESIRYYILTTFHLLGIEDNGFGSKCVPSKYLPVMYKFPFGNVYQGLCLRRHAPIRPKLGETCDIARCNFKRKYYQRHGKQRKKT
jgi:hypothetical protein